MPNAVPSPGYVINEIDCAIYLGEDGQSGGIRESWTDRGLEVNIDFICAWKDRLRLIQGLRGGATWDGTPGGKVTRQHPVSLPLVSTDECPEIPIWSGLGYFWNRFICVGTGEFEPVRWQTDKDGSVTGIQGWGFYDSVIIPTRWASQTYFTGNSIVNPYVMGYDLSGYPYTTTTTKTSGEVFSPNTSTFKFLNSGIPVNEASIGLIRAKTEIIITRHYLPGIDVASYDSLVGKINSDILTLGNKPESLLYMTYDVEPYGDASTGTTFCDIKHHIVANGLVRDDNGKNQDSWNYYMNRKGNWDKLVDSKTGKISPYYTAAFKPVIWPDYPST
jgi:hypothetical protein